MTNGSDSGPADLPHTEDHKWMRKVGDSCELDREARVHKENFVPFGADKMWDHLNQVEGIPVARCTVERLMRQMGLSGVRRGRSWLRTTICEDEAERPADLVDRDFVVEGPNRLWLADLTYVKTHTRWVYEAFHRRRLLEDGHRLAGFEIPEVGPGHRRFGDGSVQRRRAGADLTGLVHHSDMGLQYLSICCSQRLADNGVVASVGSKGDNYDNAMIESFNGLYSGSSSTLTDPGKKSKTSSSPPSNNVDWFNNRRRHGEILPGRRQFTTPRHMRPPTVRESPRAIHLQLAGFPRFG